jgi:hypothetical protein
MRLFAGLLFVETPYTLDNRKAGIWMLPSTCDLCFILELLLLRPCW